MRRMAQQEKEPEISIGVAILGSRSVCKEGSHVTRWKKAHKPDFRAFKVGFCFNACSRAPSVTIFESTDWQQEHSAYFPAIAILVCRLKWATVLLSPYSIQGPLGTS